MESKETKQTVVKVNSIGDSVLGFLLAVALLVLLFQGEPSIAESLRVAAQKWAASK